MNERIVMIQALEQPGMTLHGSVTIEVGGMSYRQVITLPNFWFGKDELVIRQLGNGEMHLIAREWV